MQRQNNKMKFKAKKNKSKTNSSKAQKALSIARQFLYPTEFRIQPLSDTDTPPELIKQLIVALNLTPQTNQQQLAESMESEHVVAYKELSRFVVSLLADVGTGLWRIKQKMIQPGTNQPLEEMRRAYRHLESTWDALTQAEVQIIDHTGEVVPEGGVYSLKVIAYEPTKGLSRDSVIETIKPSIYFKQQMIQMGEVIVGTPETTETQTGD